MSDIPRRSAWLDRFRGHDSIAHHLILVAHHGPPEPLDLGRCLITVATADKVKVPADSAAPAHMIPFPLPSLHPRRNNLGANKRPPGVAEDAFSGRGDRVEPETSRPCW